MFVNEVTRFEATQASIGKGVITISSVVILVEASVGGEVRLHSPFCGHESCLSMWILLGSNGDNASNS